MIDVAWSIPDDDRDAELTGTPRPLMGTWHYLRNALRRERRTWLGMAAVGGVIGLLAMFLLPPTSTGTVTILMAHPANLDGPSAMSTDVSLLNTREVAVRTVRQLGLTLSPDAFQGTISAEPVTTEILTVALTAPDDASATARVKALTEQYLAFRAEQFKSLNSGLITGYQTRIASAQDQVTALNREYVRVSAQGVAGQNRAAEILSRRTLLNNQIDSMQQAVEDASLQDDAAISSTHVIDPARAIRHSAKRTMVLDVGSGIIVGAGIGVVFVLFRALTSERLRRREEVALALGAPVRFSVGSDGPPGRRLRRLRRLRGRGRRRGRDVQTLVRGLESAVTPRPGASGPVKSAGTPGATTPPRGAALAAIGNAPAAAAVIGGLARHLRGNGQSVFLVDLSSSGALVKHMSREVDPRHRGDADTKGSTKAEGTAGDATIGPVPTVFRPSGVPGLARGPRGAAPGALLDLTDSDPHRAAWDAADVVLVLVEVDPGIDVENLTSWVDQVVPLVTAGLSTAELLETTADLVRAAGLRVPFAMMIGADDADDSLGLVSPSGVEPMAMVGHR